MLYITPRTDFGKGYYSVEIRSSDRELKRGDIFCSQGLVLNIIDADHKLALIRFINGHESCFRNIGEMEWFYWTKEPVVTTDWTYMPRLGPGEHGQVSTTITRDPADPRKIISLHTKFLPTMNAYNTLVLMTEEAYNNTTKKKPKVSDLVVLPFEIRLGRSSENIKAEMLRLLPDHLDIDDVTIMIEPIF